MIYVIFRAEAILAKISKERKVTYYIGLGMIVLGFILFISTFFEAAGLRQAHEGNPLWRILYRRPLVSDADSSFPEPLG